MESKLTQLFENLQTQMNNTFTSLSTNIEEVEKSVQPTPPGVDPKQTQGGVFGTPAVVNALPSQPQISDLNPATKHRGGGGGGEDPPNVFFLWRKEIKSNHTSESYV